MLFYFMNLLFKWFDLLHGYSAHIIKWMVTAKRVFSNRTRLVRNNERFQKCAVGLSDRDKVWSTIQAGKRKTTRTTFPPPVAHAQHNFQRRNGIIRKYFSRLVFQSLAVSVVIVIQHNYNNFWNQFRRMLWQRENEQSLALQRNCEISLTHLLHIITALWSISWR